MRLTSWILIAVVAFGALSASAAQVDSPAPPTLPASAMFSLEDIYNRLNVGTPGALRTGGFTNPTTGPIATRHTLNDVMAKAPTSDGANGASALQVLAGKTYWSLQTGAWGTGTGTMPNIGGVTITPGTSSQPIPLGYHDGTGTVSGDANLLSANIKAGVSIFGVSGSTGVVDTSAGTAVAGDVLSGKKAFVNGSLVTGTVPAGANVSGTNGSLTVTITDGLYSGSKTTAAADTNLLGANIKSGTSIFGVAGTALVATGNATAANVLSGQTFSNSTTAGIAGSMPNNGTVSITPGTTAQTIAAGFHNGSGTVSGDANLVTGNIKAGTTIFGVAGKTSVVETAAGTAGTGDISSGKIAYVNGAQLMGTGLIATGNASANDVSIGKTFSNATTAGVTGTRPTAPVARTGQTASYDGSNKDDGGNPKGVVPPSPRFTDNANGTVTDNLTGLIWLKNGNVSAATRTWANAFVDVASLNSAGTMNGNNAGDTSLAGSHQTDWRLPNLKELQSLIDYQNNNPALPTGHPFTGVQSNYYWSSSTYAQNTPSAWIVYLSGGGVDPATKTFASYVWPVRGGQ